MTTLRYSDADPGSMPPTAPAISVAALRTFAILVAALPALAVVVTQVHLPTATIDVVLYREPKLAAGVVLAWCFVVVAAWRLPSVWPALRQSAGPLAWMGGFAGLAVLSSGWARVPMLAGYELQQLIPFTLLVGALCAWSTQDRRAAPVLTGAIVASIAVVTLSGILQAVAPDLAHLLVPGRPATGVVHAGLMGQKNAAAHAVVGQLWLVALLGSKAARRKRWARAAGLGLLWGVEVAYVASLQSRTALAALVGTGLLAVVFAIWKHRRRGLLALAVAVVSVGLIGGVVSQNDRSVERWAVVGELVEDPSAWLETDRGVYGRNTLHMARHHPLGVGVGNWQVFYPVFRQHHREVGFSKGVQVRRAHSDPLQILAELGGLGLVLWVGLQLVLLQRLYRDWRRTGSRVPVFLAVQLLATNIATTTDYVIEMPYHKLQLYLVMALALMRPTDRVADSSPARWPRVVISLVAVVPVALALSGLVRAHQSSQLQAVFSAMVGDLQRDLPTSTRQQRFAVWRAELDRVWTAASGMPGLSKTLHQDHLMMAQTAFFAGELQRAQALLEAGLALHPHDPAFFGALAEVHHQLGNATEAARYRQLQVYIADHATDGFHPPPSLVLPSAPRRTP